MVTVHGSMGTDPEKPDNLLRLASILNHLWPAIIGIMTASGVALYLGGYVNHQSYLQFFGLRPEDFPKAYEFLVIDGYFTLIDRVSWLFKNALRPEVGGLLFIVFGFIFTTLVAFRVESKGPSLWFQKLPSLIRLILVSGWWTIFAYSASLTMVAAISLLLIVPGLMGQSVGAERAAQLAMYSMEACTKHPCSTLIHSGTTIATGHIIVTSNDRIALYDSELRIVRTIDRKDIEVRTPMIIPMAVLNRVKVDAKR